MYSCRKQLFLTLAFEKLLAVYKYSNSVNTSGLNNSDSGSSVKFAVCFSATMKPQNLKFIRAGLEVSL